MQQEIDRELGAGLGRASTTRSARPHLRPVIYAIRFDTCPCTAMLPHLGLLPLFKLEDPRKGTGEEAGEE
jgi:hypothetical protein